MARQLSQTPQGVGGGAALAVRAGAVQRAGDDAGGGRFADAADAGEHEGVGDAVQREGAAEGFDEGVLADQVVERRGAVFAGQHAVGGRSLRRRRGGWRRVAEQSRAIGGRRG